MEVLLFLALIPFAIYGFVIVGGIALSIIGAIIGIIIKIFSPR